MSLLLLFNAEEAAAVFYGAGESCDPIILRDFQYQAYSEAIQPPAEVEPPTELTLFPQFPDPIRITTFFYESTSTSAGAERVYVDPLLTFRPDFLFTRPRLAQHLQPFGESITWPIEAPAEPEPSGLISYPQFPDPIRISHFLSEMSIAGAPAERIYIDPLLGYAPSINYPKPKLKAHLQQSLAWPSIVESETPPGPTLVIPGYSAIDPIRFRTFIYETESPGVLIEITPPVFIYDRAVWQNIAAITLTTADLASIGLKTQDVNSVEVLAASLDSITLLVNDTATITLKTNDTASVSIKYKDEAAI